MDKIRLYRGDATAIDEFKLKKTSKYCLLGEGIYLTDSLRIASTYRVKGMNKFQCSFERSAFKGEFNRNTVIEKVIEKYVDHIYLQTEWGYKKDREEKIKKKAARDFHEKMTADLIKIEYLGRDTIIGREVKSRADGFMTTFEFFTEEFESSIIRVDGVIKDQALLDFIYDQQIIQLSVKSEIDKRNQFYGWKIDDQDKYVPTNCWSRVGNEKKMKFQKYLKSRGFKGAEYSGGIITTGYGIHRAFCVWDDKWVNYHKTNLWQ